MSKYIKKSFKLSHFIGEINIIITPTFIYSVTDSSYFIKYEQWLLEFPPLCCNKFWSFAIRNALLLYAFKHAMGLHTQLVPYIYITIYIRTASLWLRTMEKGLGESV